MNIDKKIEKSQLLISKDKEKDEENEGVIPILPIAIIVAISFLMLLSVIEIMAQHSDNLSKSEINLEDIKLQKENEYIVYENKVQNTIKFLKEVNQIKEIAANVTTRQLIEYIDGKVDESTFGRVLTLHGIVQFLKQDSNENLAEKIKLHDELRILHGRGEFQILFDLEADGILQENSR